MWILSDWECVIHVYLFLSEFLEEILYLQPLLLSVWKITPLSCCCIWNILSLTVSLSLVGYVVCYRPVLLSMTFSCIYNVLSLPVSWYNVVYFACYRPVIMPSHYWCRYLLSDTLRAIVPFPISKTTQIELKTKDFIFLGKSLYIHSVSTVYIPNKVS